MINDDFCTGHLIGFFDFILVFWGLFHYLFYFLILSNLKSLNQKGWSVTPQPQLPQKKKKLVKGNHHTLCCFANCHSLLEVKLIIISITKNNFRLQNPDVFYLFFFLCIGLFLIILISLKLKIYVCPQVTTNTKPTTCQNDSY